MTGHFEAKKHAYRQTQDGVVVSFVIHPNDVPQDMALASLGTRYMVAFSEIGDDEQPIPGNLTASSPEVQDTQRTVNAVMRQLVDAPRKERRPLSSLPLSQRAALRCNDPDYRCYLTSRYDPEAAIWFDVDAAAEQVRLLCDVESRAEIIAGTHAGDAWLKLDREYQSWLTDRQYAGSKR